MFVCCSKCRKAPGFVMKMLICAYGTKAQTA